MSSNGLTDGPLCGSMETSLGRGAIRPFASALTTCDILSTASVYGLRHLSPEHAPATEAVLRSDGL